MSKKRPDKPIGELATSESERKGSDALKKELRQEVFRQFVVNRFRRKLERNVEHIVGTRDISEAIKYLFEEGGTPPVNTPIEDLVAKRKELEAQLKWLDVISSELKIKLSSVKEMEESALALLDKQSH